MWEPIPVTLALLKEEEVDRRIRSEIRQRRAEFDIKMNQDETWRWKDLPNAAVSIGQTGGKKMKFKVETEKHERIPVEDELDGWARALYSGVAPDGNALAACLHLASGEIRELRAKVKVEKPPMEPSPDDFCNAGIVSRIRKYLESVDRLHARLAIIPDALYEEARSMARKQDTSFVIPPRNTDDVLFDGVTVLVGDTKAYAMLLEYRKIMAAIG